MLATSFNVYECIKIKNELDLNQTHFYNYLERKRYFQFPFVVGSSIDPTAI